MELVVKVKYGDSLRRFNTWSLDLNMENLREKIINFFNLSPDADIILSYTDGDGDLITLVNDDELRDAVFSQHLNPLRLNAELNNKNTTSNINSNPHSTSSSKFGTQQPTGQIGSILSKLSEDLVSKASASAPAITETVMHLTKLGLSHVLTLGTTNGNFCVSSHGSSAEFPGPAHSSANHVDKTSSNKGNQSESSNTAGHRDVGQVSMEGHVSCIPGDDIATSVQYKSKCPFMPDFNSDVQFKNKCPAMPDFNFDAGFDIDRHMGGIVSPYMNPNFHHRHNRRFQHDYRPRVFHRGVQCDSCGMYPIVGIRYKSNVKEDYDLCSICFAETANQSDYGMIDQPFQRSRGPFCGSGNLGFHGHRRAKLESRFIQDVTIPDGTLVPPSVPFTKIWKIQNNGCTPWPVGTQLVWIGGVMFSDVTVVQLEVSMDGVLAGEEIDIAVDFVAPAKSGSYESYWRLCSPSGQQFGQRMWVFIEVDANLSLDCYDQTRLNLNLPHVSAVSNGMNIADINVESAQNNSEPDLSGLKAEAVEMSADGCPDKGFQSLPIVASIDDSMRVGPEIPFASFPLVDSSSVPYPGTATAYGNDPMTSYPLLGSSSNSPVAAPETLFVTRPLDELAETREGNGVRTDNKNSLIDDLSARGKTPMSTYPVIDSSLDSTIISPKRSPLSFYPSIEAPSSSTSTVPLMPPSVPVSVPPPTNTQKKIISAEAEEALLKDLLEMGFMQIDLNKKILRKNDYDLDLSVDDLCNEWDPLLEELNEMGFYDEEKNKELLVKNGGSIKRVVLDLISGEKN